MGLDHGITRRLYVKNWEHTPADKRYNIAITRGGEPDKTIHADKISEVIEDVLTLRKANAIHRWFVSNVQDGEDDCKDYYVSANQLTELRDTIKQVLAASKLVEGKVANGYTFEGSKQVTIMEDGKYIKDPSVAAELLPAESGFFFGSTDYDEWYYDNLETTLAALNEALKSTEGSFYYWSSW